jgi:hypothetical protein
MRRKADDYKAFFGPEIGVSGGKISLGKGIVTGVQLETVLRQLSRIKGYQNFDKLPIPYRAVATDLVNGKAVVFKSGELAASHARQHGGAGRGGPGGVRRHDAGGRHADQQPAGRCRARHGRRRRHRRERRHAAAETRGAERHRRRGRTDAEHPDRAERTGLAGIA